MRIQLMTFVFHRAWPNIIISTSSLSLSGIPSWTEAGGPFSLLFRSKGQKIVLQAALTIFSFAIVAWILNRFWILTCPAPPLTLIENSEKLLPCSLSLQQISWSHFWLIFPHQPSSTQNMLLMFQRRTNCSLVHLTFAGRSNVESNRSLANQPAWRFPGGLYDSPGGRG